MKEKTSELINTKLHLMLLYNIGEKIIICAELKYNNLYANVFFHIFKNIWGIVFEKDSQILYTMFIPFMPIKLP